MQDRFQQALNENKHLEDVGEEFFKSALDLATELAERGKDGKPLTEKEKRFMLSSAKFMIMGLLTSKSSK